jgi:hypothetical protein
MNGSHIIKHTSSVGSMFWFLGIVFTNLDQVSTSTIFTFSTYLCASLNFSIISVAACNALADSRVSTVCLFETSIVFIIINILHTIDSSA